MDKYVQYLRVSTERQGVSQLGIEAQKRAVLDFVKCDDCIIATFEEHESGGNNERPKLKEALKMCEKTGATLVVAKLDRLSRNAAFVLTLMETTKDKNGNPKFKIVFCDNPSIDETMLGVLAIFAQHERKIMSDRQKAQYESKRQRKAMGENIKIGNAESLTDEVRQKAIEVKKIKRNSNINLINAKSTIKALIKEYSNDKNALFASNIVEKLNNLNIKTIRGFDYDLNNVRPIIKEVLKEMRLKSLPSVPPTPSVKVVKNDTTGAQIISKKLREKGKTLKQITDFLNENGFLSTKGKKFNPIQVKRLIEK